MNSHPLIQRAMLALVLTPTVFVTPGQSATLVEKGQARAIIVLPEKPSPVIESAARVLRDHIRADFRR